MTPHILLVDDSPLVTDALLILFEETGHRVTVAASVAEAVAVCAGEARPDVMLLDVTLGAEDGLAVLAVLRERAVAQPTTVALTGHDDPQTRARCLAAGCDGLLVKPVPLRELLRVVSELLAA
jgi:CheY-like chemotaxis protein